MLTIKDTTYSPIPVAFFKSREFWITILGLFAFNPIPLIVKIVWAFSHDYLISIASSTSVFLKMFASIMVSLLGIFGAMQNITVYAFQAIAYTPYRAYCDHTKDWADMVSWRLFFPGEYGHRQMLIANGVLLLINLPLWVLSSRCVVLLYRKYTLCKQSSKRTTNMWRYIVAIACIWWVTMVLAEMLWLVVDYAFFAGLLNTQQRLCGSLK